MKNWPDAGHMRRVLTVLSFACLVLSLTSLAGADEQRKHAFSSGATAVCDSGFTLALGSTLGESGVVGAKSGGGFSLIEGFWMPEVGIPTGVPELPSQPGEEVIRYTNSLIPARPNPFRDVTTISFSVADPSAVKLAIYDVAGRRVATLVDAERAPGMYHVAWAGKDGAGRAVAAGIYFARIEIGSWSSIERVLRLR